jgi:UDP-N-acetylglucosamine pyrophosphorylase (EC 2.7.7.23)/glucosamine-1-phosphate N-acetyltransferase (EC 2.3.1.157)
VVRDGTGRVVKIVEQKDASAAELTIKEINTGIYCFSAPGLFDYLSRIKAENAQKEYYLTDLIEIYIQMTGRWRRTGRRSRKKSWGSTTAASWRKRK